MSRTSRIGRIATLAAITAALLLPASDAVANAPRRPQVGRADQLRDHGKLKVQKRINIFAVCTANCTVDTTTTIKGRGYKQTFPLNGALQAGVPGGPFFKPNGPLLKRDEGSSGRLQDHQLDDGHRPDDRGHRLDRAHLQAEEIGQNAYAAARALSDRQGGSGGPLPDGPGRAARGHRRAGASRWLGEA